MGDVEVKVVGASVREKAMEFLLASGWRCGADRLWRTEHFGGAFKPEKALTMMSDLGTGPGRYWTEEQIAEAFQQLSRVQDARDETMPDGRWEFDSEVTAVFGDMLERSIPQYDVMRKAVTDLALARANVLGSRLGVRVTDLGCSRGDALAPIVERVGDRGRFTGLEMSSPMVAAARERFKDRSNVGILYCDLRRERPHIAPQDVILSVLTLQFTPMEYRQQILRWVNRSLVPGGALIIVEKVLGDTAEIDRMMVERYYDLKEENGYGPEQIERKRLSLEGVLVPVTARWNEELLRSAGFTEVDCFWRWMNFAGWVAVRGLL